MAHAFFSIGGIDYTETFDTACGVLGVPAAGVLVSFILASNQVDFSIYMEQDHTAQSFVQELRTNGAGNVISGQLIRDNKELEFVFPLIDETDLADIQAFVDAIGINYFYICDYQLINIYEVCLQTGSPVEASSVEGLLYSVTVKAELK